MLLTCFKTFWTLQKEEKSGCCIQEALQKLAEAQLMLKIVTQPRKLHLYEAYPLNRTLFLPPRAQLISGEASCTLGGLVVPVLRLQFPGAFVRSFVVIGSNFLEDFLQVGLEIEIQ